MEELSTTEKSKFLNEIAPYRQMSPKEIRAHCTVGNLNPVERSDGPKGWILDGEHGRYWITLLEIYQYLDGLMTELNKEYFPLLDARKISRREADLIYERKFQTVDEHMQYMQELWWYLTDIERKYINELRRQEMRL